MVSILKACFGGKIAEQVGGVGEGGVKGDSALGDPERLVS